MKNSWKLIWSCQTFLVSLHHEITIKNKIIIGEFVMKEKNVKVLLFNKYIYQKPYLDTLTQKELYEIALGDDDYVTIYDDAKAFQGDFNDGVLLNMKNMLIYIV